MLPDELITPPVRAILEQNALFRGLSDPALLRALDLLNAVPRNVPGGGILHQPGEPMNFFGLVLKGRVSVLMTDITGAEILMQTVLTGGTFGESLCYLRADSSRITIRSDLPSTILYLKTAGLLLPAPEDLPEAVLISKRFTAMLAARTLAMNRRIQILARTTIRARLIVYFSQLAEDAGVSPEDGLFTFTVPFDRAGMAAFLGTDRSALSRELSRMKREGLVDYEKNRFTLHMQRTFPKDSAILPT